MRRDRRRHKQLPERTVILEGEIGDLFGREWRLRVPTPRHALSLIKCNQPGIVSYLARASRDGLQFVVTINGTSVDADRLLRPIGKADTLVIMPAYLANGSNTKGALTLVAGVLLIALSVFTAGASGAVGAGLLGTGIGAGGTAGFVGGLGLALVFSGAATLIAGQPKFQKPSERSAENQASYLFDGPNNRARQGNAKALIYGKMIVGGQPVSLGIENEQWESDTEADIGTVDGNGYADSAKAGLAGQDYVYGEGVFGENVYGGWSASGGGKGGGQEQQQAVEAPDSYRSISFARVQDLLGEGELYGPLDDNWNLITTATRLGAALLLDETQVLNNDGTFNFKNVKAWFQPGTPDQKHVPGFDTTESEVDINSEVVQATPIVTTISDTTVDAVRVTVRIPAMYSRNQSNGNVDGSTVDFKFEMDVDSGGYTDVLTKTIRQKNMNPTLHSYRLDLPSFSTDVKIRMTRVSADSTDSAVQNSIYFNSRTDIQDEKLNHPNSAKLSWDIDATQFSRIPNRAIRVGGIKVQVPDNYNPLTKVYTGAWGGGYSNEWTDNPAWIFLDLITNIRYGLGRWISISMADVGELYTIAQACDELVTQGIAKSVTLIQAFSTSATSIVISIPQAWMEDGDTIQFTTQAVTINGKIRQGAIDANLTAGSLIVGARYRIISITGGASFTGVGASADTVDVAFIATGTTPTWGSAGELQPLYYTASVDATAGGESAEDVGVYTGKEPRYTCNVTLETQEDAFQVLSDMASSFNSMAYWGAGTFKAVQDVAKDSALQFTRANVIGGNFKYTSTALKSRHTTANVRWNDPNNFMRADLLYVEDSVGMFKHGVRDKSIVAFGCTSQGQAMRKGREILYTERLETLGVEFVAGMEAHALTVGDIVDTYDDTQTAITLSGRTKAVSTTEAVLDRNVTLASGATYAITFIKKDGSGLVSSTISTAAGDVSAVTYGAISAGDLPVQTGVFLIQDTTTATKRQWRILSITEGEGSDRGQFTIVGLLYASEKFALIEAFERQSERVQIDSLRQCKPISGLDVVTERISTNLATERYANATWSASPDRNVRSYILTSRRNDADWEPSRKTASTTMRVKLDAPGLYEIQVIAVNTLGVKSGPVSTTFTLTDDGLVIGTTSPPKIDPLGGVKPDAVSLTDVRMLNEEGESEVRYTVTNEEQITSGTPTSGQLYEIIDSTTSGEILTSGATTNLRSYRIHNNGGGASDFTGVGAADNNVGTIFTANGGTPDYTGGGEIQQDTNSDFKIAGSANNTIGTTFTANGTAPYWGTDGELRKITDTDPLTTSETVYTFNPNWLTYSNNWSNAAWTKVNGAVSDEGVNSDPDGTKNSDQVIPSGAPSRIQIYQDITPTNLYKGQYWCFSGYERVTNSTFALLTFKIIEKGGSAADASTSFDFVPTPGAWGLRQLVHQIQQSDRTSIRVEISAESANNPNDKFLFLYKYQMEVGRQRTGAVINTSTAGGKFTVASYAGTTSVRARTFITEEVFSDMAEVSYDFDDGATIVAEPDVRPHGATNFEGTEFPLFLTMECLEAGAAIKYTTDGSDPVTGTTYSVPFSVATGKQVRAIATKATFTDSEERDHLYRQGF